jgi:hypothetical protein
MGSRVCVYFNPPTITRVTPPKPNKPATMLSSVREATLLALILSTPAVEAAISDSNADCSPQKPCPGGMFCAYYIGPVRIHEPEKCAHYPRGNAINPPSCKGERAMRDECSPGYNCGKKSKVCEKCRHCGIRSLRTMRRP